MNIFRISNPLRHVLSIILLFSGLALKGAEPTPPSIPVPCVANFEPPAKPLSPHFLGANTAFYARPYDYTNPEVIKLTRQLNLQNIRVLGGAPSNWFNWKTGTFYTNDVLAKRVPPDELKANKATPMQVQMDKYHPSFKNDDMVAFCRGMGAIPIWETNILSGTPEEEAEWVGHNKKAGNPNTFWELGNEIYLRPYHPQFPTVEAYIKIAKEYASAMKAADPSIQVGIDGMATRAVKPNSSQGDGEWVPNSDNSDWDKAVAKESFYDGLVIHDYFVANTELIGKSEDEVHRYLMAHNALNMPDAIDYYRRTFGKNVNLWITEWNVYSYLGFAYKADPSQLPKDFVPAHYWLCRTVDHALFVADWYLEALRYPENIKITDIHVLAGQGYWGLFQLPAPEKDNTDKAFLINSPYYAVQWVGDAIKRSDSYKFAQIEGGPVLKGGIAYSKYTFPGVVAGAFFKDGAITSALLINKTTETQSVSLKGIGQASPQGATSQCLTGLEPLEGWGKDKPVKDENVWRPQINISTSTISGTEIVLPAASLTYLVFK